MKHHLPAKLASCPRNSKVLPKILRMKPTARLDSASAQVSYDIQVAVGPYLSSHDRLKDH